MLSQQQKNNLCLGYCCINVTLRSQKDSVFCSRTCRLETLVQKGIEYSYYLAKQNLDDLEKIFKWNYQNNISLYRMSSDMFPFSSHPDYSSYYNFEQFREKLAKLGESAKKYNQRITFHPGQYNQLTSIHEHVVVKSIIEIDIHAKIMDMMGCDHQSVIVIHGGSTKGGKHEALQRFKNNFARLSKSSKMRLVLENCELSYTIDDLLPVSQELDIPIVIDYHHYNLHKTDECLHELTQKVLVIWKKRNIIPLFHISESRCGVLPTDSITVRRAHSDYIENLPEPLIQLLKTERIDVDVEAKMKELAVFKLIEKYQLSIT
jgi:UV DNA damage endonuclease